MAATWHQRSLAASAACAKQHRSGGGVNGEVAGADARGDDSDGRIIAMSIRRSWKLKRGAGVAARHSGVENMTTARSSRPQVVTCRRRPHVWRKAGAWQHRCVAASACVGGGGRRAGGLARAPRHGNQNYKNRGAMKVIKWARKK